MATRRMRIKAVANVPLAARGRPDRPVTPIATEPMSMPASPLGQSVSNMASPLASVSSVVILQSPVSPRPGNFDRGPFSPTYSKIPPKTPPPFHHYHQPPSPSSNIYPEIHSPIGNQHFRPTPSVSPLPPSASLLQNIRSPSPVKLIHPPSPKRPDTPKGMTYINVASPSGLSNDGDNSRSAFSAFSPPISGSHRQRPNPAKSPIPDGGFLSPRPVSLASPRPVQCKTPNNFSTLNINQNSNSSSDSTYSEGIFFPGKVEKIEESQNKHSFRNKFGAPGKVINNNTNSSGLLASSLQKSVNSTETLKQRLQKPSAAFTLTKYQVARKDFLTKLNSQQETPKRSEMTMLHFAFWNPPKPKGPRSRATSICDEQEFFGGSNSNTENSVMSVASITARRATIGAVPITKEEKPKPIKPEPEEKKPLGPRVKVGPDGKLIIDEKSLVVETTESVRAKKQLAEMKTVSGAEFAIGSGFYRHKKLNKRGSDWAVKETVRFYRALSTCGTDFSMMTSLFPNRTRAELKSKFKREDRRNKAQVDAALSCQQFNPMEGFSSDEEDILADERHDNMTSSSKTSVKLKSFENISSKGKNCPKGKNERFYAHPMTKEVLSDGNSNKNSSNVKTMTNISANVNNINITSSNSDNTGNNSATVKLPKTCINVKLEKSTPTKISVPPSLLPISDATKPPAQKNTSNETSPSRFISDVTRIDIQSTIESIGKNVFAQNFARKQKMKTAKKLEVNTEDKPKKRVRKQKVTPTVSNQRGGSATQPITVTDAEVDTRPDILRFDPSDPLGFKVVVPSGGIVIDIKNPERIIQEDQLNERTKDNLSDAKVLNTGIRQVIGPINTQIVKPKPKRKLPFRVPGPGGPPTPKTASLADEIEIEISCN